MRKFIFTGLVIALCAICLHCSSIAASYTAQALGVAPGYDGSEAIDVNNSGVVICWAATAYDSGGAFTWSTGTGITPLQRINAFAGINNQGQTAGVYTDTDPYWEFEPLIRNINGTESRLRVPEGVSNAWVREILDDSNIYATYEYRDSDGYVIDNKSIVIDDTSKTTYIELPNDSLSSIEVSDNGLFVINNKYFWTVANGASVIPFLENEESVDVQCVSNNGWIVGAQNGSLVRWDSAGNRLDLGIGTARDINSLGQVVGSINNQAVIWNIDGSVTNLSTLAGYSYSSASAINDNGQIVGSARESSSAPMAVLWEPVPEPSAILTLLCGITTLTSLAIRRKK